MNRVSSFYTLILISLTGWVVLGYVTVRDQIDRQYQLSEMINTSGKQRMLSQKIALSTTLLVHSEGDERARLLQQKQDSINDLLKNHEYLLAQIHDSDILDIYYSPPYSIDQSVKNYITLASTVPDISEQASYIKEIASHSSKLLGKLDVAVSAIQNKAQDLTFKVQQRELWIVFGTLCTVLIEFIAIFLPTLQKLKANESQLLKSKKTFQRLIELSPDGVQIIDMNGNIRLFSEMASQMLGYPYERMKQLKILDWDCKLSPSELDNLLDELSEDNITLFETKHLRQDGSTYDALISARLIQLDNEQMIYATVKDVTSLNKMKRERELSAMKLKIAAQSANMGIWQWNPANGDMVWDEKMFAIYDVDNVLSFDDWREKLIDVDRERAVSELESAIRNNHNFQTTFSIKISNGSIRTIQATAKPFFDDHGENIMLIGTNLDITDRCRMENEKGRYLKLIDNNIISSTTDLNGIITEVSLAFCRLTGYTKEELIGHKHRLVAHPDTPKSYYETLWLNLNADKSWSGEVKNRSKQGREYWLKSHYSPIFDESNVKIGYSEISQEITDKKRAEYLAHTDPLTDLYNRTHLDEVAKAEIERAKIYKQQSAIIILDIDHFKSINDNFGHLTGDDVLRSISHILKNNCRTSDCIGRWGGEEFLIVCPNINLNAAIELAERLRHLIATYHFNNVGHITSSFGVTLFKVEDIDIDDVFKRADAALYVAKEQGRNRVMSML
ncbi:diguanylate cyclase [Vibrio sp. CAIM 722]|uniref:Diguanylate cyclase n=1 Tax=Vibrio eleionomae TaxID=2653505 RepID=A0A7X4RVE5_9VIBR|nr:diguanylate cyclase [Vibrio eleionomae]MZI94896.1 diguanylate cyclase [Vibrio eleionomae]